MALKDYIKVHHTPALTKHNMRLRDQYCCAYCGHQFGPQELTWDHVIPRSQGGRTSWMNIVLACSSCNSRKGNQTPDRAGMPLLWRPWVPSNEDLARVEYRLRHPKFHKDWVDFLDLDLAA